MKPSVQLFLACAFLIGLNNCDTYDSMPLYSMGELDIAYTGGDFNVGPSSTDKLVELIEEKRESGIYLTVLGVGGGNLNDEMMEQIANKGNGNYEYIDNARQITKVFTNEMAKFYTVAKDAKIQITFDFRYKKPGEDESRLLTHEISMIPADINSASENMRFAAAITGFGLLMKQSDYKGTASRQLVLYLGQDVLTFDPFGYRKEFIDLVNDWSE
jgi:hypothetical protein